MNISISVMAHPKRQRAARNLYDKLNRMQFHSVELVVDTNNDEWTTGKRALQAHSDSDYHLVIQDDAIIPDTFYFNVERALAHIPSPSLASFYLGQVRPYPSTVTKAYESAMEKQASWIKGRSLYWGVCLVIPTNMIYDVINEVDESTELYDNRIGSYFKKRNLDVYYSAISLADHDYTAGSLIGHDSFNQQKPRIAHCYIGEDIVDTWNKDFVNLGV